MRAPYRPILELLEVRTTPALIASQLTLSPPLLTGGPGGDVDLLLQRAAAATASDDAIIAVVDRNGTILGVRVEGGVSPSITGNQETLDFAVDGAVSLARTAAFFGNDQAPLTSRTVGFISQSTITQREVDSNPNINIANSPLRGPGYVAAIGIKDQFPPGVNFTPQVDLFEIEHTNRDSILHPGADHLKGTADDVPLQERFNINPAFVPPGQALTPPLAYGEAILSPANVINPAMNHYQNRGIATLPGGIPLFEDGVVVGGIGVFFPGKTGYASEENSSLSADYNPAKPDRTLEAEFMGLAAAGGSLGAGFPVGALAGVPAIPGFNIPFGRIELAGISLDVIGPGGTQGPAKLVQYAYQFLGVGQGNPNSGTNLPVDSLGTLFKSGKQVPEGWLVTPHAGVNITAAQVAQIIQQGINEEANVRAQIRIPNDERARFVFAVADSTGEVLGLFRTHDATVFSIDVAVAKARNEAYYNDPAQLQPVDQVPGIPAGVAFTNRTFRYLTQPRFPEGITGQPGPFSILNDPGINPNTALNTGAPLPASSYQSVQGFDSFNPGTNFHAPTLPQNQNGVVFFPGASGVYTVVSGQQTIVGGFGVSGDGVDEDDVTTFFGIKGFEPPQGLRVDNFKFRNVRLPYQNFNRNPEG